MALSFSENSTELWLHNLSKDNQDLLIAFFIARVNELSRGNAIHISQIGLWIARDMVCNLAPVVRRSPS